MRGISFFLHITYYYSICGVFLSLPSPYDMKEHRGYFYELYFKICGIIFLYGSPYLDP